MEEGGGDDGSGAPTAGRCLSSRGRASGRWLKYRARRWWLGRGGRGGVGRRGRGRRVAAGRRGGKGEGWQWVQLGEGFYVSEISNTRARSLENFARGRVARGGAAKISRVTNMWGQMGGGLAKPNLMLL